MSLSLEKRIETIDEFGECPLVSIVVLSYNSEKYIQETLDSIYCQTYPKIELILADDCSCDKTVDIINKFIQTSSTRFTTIKLLESPQNAGTSANCNKGEMACAGDWIKILAADDILLPDCIQKYVAYLTKHPDANFIFSKVEIFGENDDFVDYFDYSFFSKSRNEQLHQLIFQGNCIPAPSAFFRTKYVRQLGITNDERVPLIEDLPKWINLLNKGTEFSFIDETLVKYRTGGGTTSKALMSKALYHSSRLLTFLYLFPVWERNGYEYAVERIIEEEMEIYDNLLFANSQIQKIKKSHTYKIGKLIIKPFSFLRSLLS